MNTSGTTLHVHQERRMDQGRHSRTRQEIHLHDVVLSDTRHTGLIPGGRTRRKCTLSIRPFARSCVKPPLLQMSQQGQYDGTHAMIQSAGLKYA